MTDEISFLEKPSMDWLDYFTPLSLAKTGEDSRARRLLRDDEDDEQLNKAIWTWKISQQTKKDYSSAAGRTYQVDLPNERFFVVHDPLVKEQSLPLLIFCHGLNSSAWYCALVQTGWLELSVKYKFLVAFGQGQGTFYPHGPLRDKDGGLGFGDLYWEIEEPKGDFDYLDSVLSYMKEQFADRLDPTRIYFMGYSNGALFSSNVAVHYGHRVFAALCNHCGGFGGQYNEEKMLSPLTIDAPLPIYILTGVDDAYYDSCLKAKELFQAARCPVQIDVREGRGHSYYKEREEYLWTHFFLNKDNIPCQ